jgi:hypothetical protein
MCVASIDIGVDHVCVRALAQDNKFYVLDFGRCFPPEAPTVYVIVIDTDRGDDY